MSSPFPGMDPYLENPVHWPTLQGYFMTHLADTLSEILPRRYTVRVEDRVYTNTPEVDISPYIPLEPLCLPSSGNHVTRSKSKEPAITPPWNIPSTPEEVREPYLLISAAIGNQRPLTVIEFLSFPNKTVGTEGRKLYRAQQQRALVDELHLVEIDLLRFGMHSILAPQERVLRRGRYHYLVSLSRAGGREFCEVWGMSLWESLPKIAIPLAGTDPDVVLDLQSLLAYCYTAGGFARRIDYQQDPHVPLGIFDSERAVVCLRGGF